MTENCDINEPKNRTKYTYDPANRIASITYPSGAMVSYIRDVMGRITAVSAQPKGGTTISVVSNVAYDPFGPYTSLTYGNGVGETRGFDQDYRLTALIDSGTISQLQNLSYSYYPTNNVQTITDRVNSGNSQSFFYDTLQRLTSAQGGYGAFTFSYDANGNRLSQTLGSVTTNYGYVPAGDLLTTLSVGGVVTQAIGYTADGRIASLNPGIQTPAGQYITSLSYNQDARLSAVNAAGGALANYTYDGFGRRLAKAVSGNYGEIYQYGQDGLLLEQTNASGVAQEDYIYLEGQPVATFAPSSGVLYFLHDDLLGTPQLATDSNQNLAWQAQYQPFGQPSVSGTITQNLRLPGQYFDLESGWNHNGLRNYFPSLGRYAEPDPLAIQGSARHIAQTGLVVSDYLNSVEWGGSMYVYAVNSPTSIVDPTGGQTLAVGPNTTPEQVAAFNAGFAEALNRLKNNPDCRKLFCKNKGGLDPEKVLDDTEYRILPFEGSHAGAQTNSVNSVFLNLNGPFFGNPSKNGTATTYIPSSNPQLNTSTQITFGSQSQLQAFILLHELGHQLGIFPDDVFKFINGSNSLKVLEHCFKDAKYN